MAEKRGICSKIPAYPTQIGPKKEVVFFVGFVEHVNLERLKRGLSI